MNGNYSYVIKLCEYQSISRLQIFDPNIHVACSDSDNLFDAREK